VSLGVLATCAVIAGAIIVSGLINVRAFRRRRLAEAQGMDQRSRRRGGPGWVLILALSFLTPVLIWLRVTDWRLQHSGVPARMTVSECSKGKNSSCWGPQPDTIPQKVDDPSHPGQTMEIQVPNPDRSNIKVKDAVEGDIGHEIDVHVHYTHRGSGTFANKDGSAAPFIWIGEGCALGLGAVVALVFQLRRRKVTPE
jgi:hypothetical protein